MKIKINWTRALVELIVIFAGVYAAFMLNNYREQNRKEQARLKFYNTFLADLKNSTERIKRLKKLVDKRITQIESSESWDIPYARKLDLLYS